MCALLPQVDNIWALQFGHDAFPSNGVHNQLFLQRARTVMQTACLE